MAKHHLPLTPEVEREQIETMLGESLDGSIDAPGHYVATGFDPDDGECVLGEATSLREAVRLIARHMTRAGTDEDDEDVKQLTSSGPLSSLEFDTMADLFEQAMDITTSLEGETYLGEVTEEHPGLELVVGWDAAPPLHDTAFGIYRASAPLTKTSAPLRKASAPAARAPAPIAQAPAPTAPATKPPRFWN
ncbi:MAG: hypothetical protein EOO75_04350 [Myxococcales bacterium]|nr:MAG: hypothetical protein EOO75_04350 [Myxococcales bacterium]